MQVPMRLEDFHRFPRHPDWKHEYWDGALQLSYRPRSFRLVRDVALPVAVEQEHSVRLATEVPTAFLTEAWRQEEPFSVHDDELSAQWLAGDLEKSAGQLVEGGIAIAEEDDEIIGALLVERPYRDDPGPMLSWLTVRWGYRCDGVATALLAAVLGPLQAAGVEQLCSGAAAGNRASVAWHWRTGFRILPDPLARFTPAARDRQQYR